MARTNNIAALHCALHYAALSEFFSLQTPYPLPSPVKNNSGSIKLMEKYSIGLSLSENAPRKNQDAVTARHIKGRIIYRAFGSATCRDPQRERR